MKHGLIALLTAMFALLANAADKSPNLKSDRLSAGRRLEADRGSPRGREGAQVCLGCHYAKNLGHQLCGHCRRGAAFGQGHPDA